MCLKWYVDRMDLREEGRLEGRAQMIAPVLRKLKSAAKTAKLLHCPIEEVLAVAREKGIEVSDTQQ